MNLVRTFLIGCLFHLTSYLPAQEIVGYDVFLIAGQSNTLAGCCVEAGEVIVHEDVLQLGRYGENNLQIIPAVDPLEHHSLMENKIGFATTFASLYANAYLASDRKVLLIPAGKGGTGFADDNWNPGDTLYNDAVMRTNHVLNKIPHTKLKGILWHQGERDILKHNRGYEESLDNMLNTLRKDITHADENTPIILGGMVPYWVDQKKRRREEQKIIMDTPNRISNVWFANPYKPFVIEKPDNTVDDIHYDAAGQKELGVRYFNAWQQVLAKEKNTSEE